MSSYQERVAQAKRDTATPAQLQRRHAYGVLKRPFVAAAHGIHRTADHVLGKVGVWLSMHFPATDAVAEERQLNHVVEVLHTSGGRSSPPPPEHAMPIEDRPSVLENPFVHAILDDTPKEKP